MRVHKIGFKTLCLYVAICLYALIILVRPYLISTMGTNGKVSMLILVGILFLIFAMRRRGRLRKQSLTYIKMLFLVLIPFFYNNAYIEDGMYSYVTFYVGAIVFCMLLSMYYISENEVKFIFRIFICFAIMTSIVTWFSFVFPDQYDAIFISKLPFADQLTARNDFWNQGMRMGLSNHYSRNAFYLILGIIGVFVVEKDQKRRQILLGLFFLTLLLVGKRGHFVFIVLSFFLAYVSCGKWNLNKMKNLVKYIVLGVLSFVMAVRFIPGVSNMMERMLIKGGVDIASGRFVLYERVWSLFQTNNYRPLGWCQFSKSTHYLYAGVHNDYLQLLCETGIIGLGIILFVNIFFLQKTLKIVRSNKGKINSIYFVALVYQIFFMLYSLTGIPHYDIETYMVYFFIVSLLYNFRGGGSDEYQI